MLLIPRSLLRGSSLVDNTRPLGRAILRCAPPEFRPGKTPLLNTEGNHHPVLRGQCNPDPDLPIQRFALRRRSLFLTNSVPNFTWVTFNSFRSKAFTCSLCSAATRSQRRTVSSLTSMTSATPTQGHSFDQQFQCHEDFLFRGKTVAQKDCPGPLTERTFALPAQKLTNRSPVQPRVDPIGDDISVSLLTEQLARGFGQASLLRSYVGFRPLFPILTTFSRVIMIKKEILSVNY